MPLAEMVLEPEAAMVLLPETLKYAPIVPPMISTFEPVRVSPCAPISTT